MTNKTSDTSQSSFFAGERTMPTILPPIAAMGNMGSAPKRDSFALGLLVAGLVRCRNTETVHMYKGLELNSQWSEPAPPLKTDLQELVLGLVDINPKKRLKPREALDMLPPPGSWFQLPVPEEDKEVVISI